MDIRFNGKRAIVTGAGRGIGEAIALKLVELGAHVFAISVTKENLERLKKKAPTVQIRCIDVSDWEATRQCVKEICPIDLLVNNAAVLRFGSILTSTQDDIDSVFDVNFKAMFNIAQVVAEDIKARGMDGSIVNMSSAGGTRAAPDYSVYSASKAAVEMLTKSLAVELAPYKIRANSVASTIVLTDMGKEVVANAGGDYEALKNGLPAGEFAEVDDVVNAVIYLLSDKSKMISGVNLPIDGAQLAAL